MRYIIFLFIFTSSIFLQAQDYFSKPFECTEDMEETLRSPDAFEDDSERLYIAVENYCYNIASNLIKAGTDVGGVLIDGETILDAHLLVVTITAGFAMASHIDDIPLETRQKAVQLRLDLINAGGESPIFKDQIWPETVEAWLNP